jgi:glycosyltransferase involved in cell wall biosynthesis
MIAFSYYESDPRVIREAEAAVEGGFEVDFLALRRPGTPPEEVVRGVRLIRVNQVKYRGSGQFKYLLQYLTFFFTCFLKTTALFVRRRYGVIHVNNMPDFLVFCAIVPRLFGSKVILDIHDPMPNTFASKFKSGEHGFFYTALLWQERLSAAFCSQVTTVHDPVKDGILVKHGLASKSLEVIGNFADDQLFPLRTAYSIQGKIRFVFHGTILERSGLRTLMTALEGVRHKARISVTIIGEGDFSEPLRRIIDSSNLGEIVEFDNRSYPVHAIPERISDCNVGLVPLEISSITNYALPLKLLEYVSLGLPVVTVRNKAISYYFCEEDCIFFEWNEPSSLSAAMDRIAGNPELLLAYRERSVALRSRLSWTREKQKYISLLHQLTSAGEA